MRPWIKQPVTKLQDARMHFVSVQAQRDYFMMYLLAGQLDAEGLFFENGRRLTDKEIAFRINTAPVIFNKSIKELQREKLLHVNGKGPVIVDWRHEQIDWRKKQEEERERQARHRIVTRDSEHVTGDSEPVTLLDVDVDVDVDKKKIKIKDQPPPTPSTKTGRQADEKKDKRTLLIADLKGKQKRRAGLIHKILNSLGIRNPKLETTSIIVATRTYKNDQQMITEVLAAIASAYSDNTVKSKEAVTLHRIETGKIPASFLEDRGLWRSIPVKTLEIAGIDITTERDKKIQALRNRSKDSNE